MSKKDRLLFYLLMASYFLIISCHNRNRDLNPSHYSQGESKNLELNSQKEDAFSSLAEEYSFVAYWDKEGKGPQPESEHQQKISLRSTSASKISHIKIEEPSCPEFHIQASNCFELDPQKECFLSVTFSPKADGLSSCTLHLSYETPFGKERKDVKLLGRARLKDFLSLSEMKIEGDTQESGVANEKVFVLENRSQSSEAKNISLQTLSSNLRLSAVPSNFKRNMNFLNCLEKDYLRPQEQCLFLVSYLNKNSFVIGKESLLISYQDESNTFKEERIVSTPKTFPSLSFFLVNEEGFESSLRKKTIKIYQNKTDGTQRQIKKTPSIPTNHNLGRVSLSSLGEDVKVVENLETEEGQESCEGLLFTEKQGNFLNINNAKFNVIAEKLKERSEINCLFRLTINAFFEESVSTLSKTSFNPPEPQEVGSSYKVIFYIKVIKKEQKRENDQSESFFLFTIERGV